MTIPVIESNQIINVTSNTSSTGSVDITGLGLQQDDLVIPIIAIDGDAANPTASGYGTITSASQGAVELYYLWKRMGATPDTTVTINWTGNEQCRIMLLRVSGVIKTGDPWDDIADARFNGGSTQNSAIEPTSTIIDTLMIGSVAVDRNRVDAADTPTGWIEVGISGSSGGNNGAGLIVGEIDQPPIGTPVSLLFQTWQSDQNVSRCFNLKSEPVSRTEHWQGYIPQPLI